jgi:hypothetical protein
MENEMSIKPDYWNYMLPKLNSLVQNFSDEMLAYGHPPGEAVPKGEYGPLPESHAKALAVVLARCIVATELLGAGAPSQSEGEVLNTNKLLDYDCIYTAVDMLAKAIS